MTDNLEEIRLGIDAEAFITSRLGKYLIGRIDQEREEAIEEFKNTNPADTEKIMLIQYKLWREETLKTWLFEAVQAGDFAEMELKSNN